MANIVRMFYFFHVFELLSLTMIALQTEKDSLFQSPPPETLVLQFDPSE